MKVVQEHPGEKDQLRPRQCTLLEEIGGAAVAERSVNKIINSLQNNQPENQGTDSCITSKHAMYLCCCDTPSIPLTLHDCSVLNIRPPRPYTNRRCNRFGPFSTFVDLIKSGRPWINGSSSWSSSNCSIVHRKAQSPRLVRPRESVTARISRAFARSPSHVSGCIAMAWRRCQRSLTGM